MTDTTAAYRVDRSPDSNAGQDRALSGIRVIDLGMITAGAATSQVLADFGADVIKVESPSRPDPFRNWNQIVRDGDPDLNQSPPFHAVNRNKRGVGIDLKHPDGVSVFLDLIAGADVVVENFRRGVMQNLGLSFDDLRQVNPRIVLLSLSSQGETGPESRYVSFGSTLEAVGGSMSLTGVDGSHPVWTGNNVNFPDQLVSLAAPAAVLAALLSRDLTGEGVHVDFSQRESVTSVIGDAIVDYQLSGVVPGPRANADPNAAAQGVYATSNGGWIAMTAATLAQWHVIARVLDIDAAAPPEGRDRAISAAVIDADAAEIAAALQEAGVAASRVNAARDLLEDPQLDELGFFVEVPGRVDRYRGFIAQLSETPGRIRRAAPDLGEHTIEVLTDELGYDRRRIDDLLESGAIFAR